MNAGGIDLPKDLVEYIARTTGLSREVIVRVLKCERRYYIEKLDEVLEA